MAVSMEGGGALVSTAAPGDVDFAKYRKPELFQRIQALLGVRQMVMAVIGWALLELGLVWVSVPVLLGGRVHWGIVAALSLYGSLAGAAAGAMFGCARAVNKSLDDFLEVLDLSFELAGQAADDLAEIRAATKAWPSARELYLQVFEQAIVPTVKAVVLSQARWFGRPAFWLYRATLGRLVRRALSSMRDTEVTEQQLAEVAESAEAVACASSGWIAVARQRVAGTAELLRRGVMVPLYAVTVVLELAAVIPLMITWYVAA
jgi:hypothetical protein